MPERKGSRFTYLDVPYLISYPSCHRLRDRSKEVEQKDSAIRSSGVRWLRSLHEVSTARLNHVARKSRGSINCEPVHPECPISYPHLSDEPCQETCVAAAHDEACFLCRFSSWFGMNLYFGTFLPLRAPWHERWACGHLNLGGRSALYERTCSLGYEGRILQTY